MLYKAVPRFKCRKQGIASKKALQGGMPFSAAVIETEFSGIHIVTCSHSSIHLGQGKGKQYR